MESKPVQFRNEFLDFSKGALIFLVVYGHSLAMMPTNQGDVIYHFIYLFHMPLFMAISGYLAYKSVAKYPPAVLLKNRFLSFYVPVLSWSVPLKIVTICLKARSDGNILWSILDRLPAEILKFTWQLWYLWVLWLSIAIFSLLALKKANRPAIIILLCFAAILLPDLLMPFKLNFPFFCLGYLVAQFGVPSVCSKLSFWIASSVAAIALYPFVITKGQFLPAPIAVAFQFACTIALSLVFLKALWFIHRLAWLGFFLTLGKYTLGIYIIHWFLLETIARLPLPFRNSGFFAFAGLPFIAAGSCAACYSALAAVDGIKARAASPAARR